MYIHNMEIIKPSRIGRKISTILAILAVPLFIYILLIEKHQHNELNRLQLKIFNQYMRGTKTKVIVVRKVFSNTTKEYHLSDGLSTDSKKYIKYLNLTRPGEDNKPIILRNPIPKNIKKLYKKLYNEYGFNAFGSSLMSLNRKLPDVRDESCKNRTYRNEKFQKVSIILPFNNEEWTLLIRSIHSIIRKSPLHLIEEIILVDDFSSYDHLKEKLENYVNRLPVTIKIVRSHVRLGIINNRVLGARNANAAIIIYLDSHIEVIDGWLEPILDRFVDDLNKVVVPNISVTNGQTFAVDFAHNAGKIMGFNWGLRFEWIDTDWYEGDNPTPIFDPKPTPTAIFGVLAIGRKYFEKIGYLDTDFDVYGGEDIELSLRVWMCGGKVEFIPCSIVSHVSRQHKYSHSSEGKGGPIWNRDRTAETWMGKYKEKYYEEVKEYESYSEDRDFGDILKRLQLKSDLNCKDFEWYLDNVYPALRSVE